MPGSQEFLELFGLRKGLVLGGFRLIQAKTTHEQIVLWRRYRYSISLKFEWTRSENPTTEDINTLHDLLSSHVSGIRIWISPANRRWKCIFSETGILPDLEGEGKHLILNCVGSGKLTSKGAVESGEALDLAQW